MHLTDVLAYGGLTLTAIGLPGMTQHSAPWVVVFLLGCLGLGLAVRNRVRENASERSRGNRRP